MKALIKAKNVEKIERMAELNDIVEQTYHIEQTIFRLTKQVEKNKKTIEKYMGKNKNINITTDDGTHYNVIKQIQPKLEFFPDALRKSIGKERFKKVSRRITTLKNKDKLIKFLKLYDVPYKEFVKFIDIQDIVDVEKVDFLVDIGEIKIEELRGCYTAEFDTNIRVRKIK